MIQSLAIGIKCRECEKHWKASLKLSGNTIEAFAAVCDCGNLLVGNYHFSLHKTLNFSTEITPIQKKKIFLNNGHFDIFSLQEQDMVSFDELFLE